MLDFNIWTFNSRVFPLIESLNVQQGDRVRVRVGNLTMTNHPIHIHGHEFEVTGTDGGPVPLAARWPEVTTDIAVGQMRQLEFMANELGDWAMHCHKSHHTMNAMGHDFPTLIGVDQEGVDESIQELLPDYAAMGGNGMGEMERMRMSLPENTVPMMDGEGPYGPIGMGGMFTVLKVRKKYSYTDNRDSGWFEQEEGTRADECLVERAPELHRKVENVKISREFKAIKPVQGHGGHGSHGK
ncbi:MAG: multicopper oxidase domain-containing protein, partial [Gammaproteobacteria bacterium]|nr:multicopper oxidase domain-containing protein [Gammaproteobacteria bacterium]